MPGWKEATDRKEASDEREMIGLFIMSVSTKLILKPIQIGGSFEPKDPS